MASVAYSTWMVALGSTIFDAAESMVDGMISHVTFRPIQKSECAGQSKCDGPLDLSADPNVMSRPKRMVMAGSASQGEAVGDGRERNPKAIVLYK